MIQKNKNVQYVQHLMIDNSLVYESATFQLIRSNERRLFERSLTVKCTFTSLSSLIFPRSLWYPLIIAMDQRSRAIDRHDSCGSSILFAVPQRFIGTRLAVISSFVNREISLLRGRKGKIAENELEKRSPATLDLMADESAGYRAPAFI